MTTLDDIRAEAVRTTGSLSIEQLVDAFAETEDLDGEEGIPEVRGWLMDELERRDRAAFEAWLDTPEASVADLRTAYGL